MSAYSEHPSPRPIALVEQLESRCLLAAHGAGTAVITGGMLDVRGSNRGDVISVSIDAQDATKVAVTINGNVSTFSLSDITAGIRVDGRNGADDISVNEDHGAVGKLFTLLGGNGGDTIVGGSGDDSLLGGNGKDHLNGEAGDDSLLGGNGMDDLLGDVGDDSLLGGNGKDDLSGGDGADSLSGGRGHDDVLGGNGSDDFSGDRSSELGDDDSSDTVHVIDDHGND